MSIESHELSSYGAEGRNCTGLSGGMLQPLIFAALPSLGMSHDLHRQCAELIL